nr:hypothetical protein [Tanacetum cinerariifolium]
MVGWGEHFGTVQVEVRCTGVGVEGYGEEHLDTIPATKSDEVTKSSVEDLVSIPSESKGIPDTMCDVHLVNNPTPLEAKDQFEIVINSNDDYSSSDDDSLYYENIEYVEASPHDSKFVSLEVENEGYVITQSHKRGVWRFVAENHKRRLK